MASIASGAFAEREIKIRSRYNLERSASISALATIAAEAMRDAPYRPITAFFCSQTLSAPEPARFRGSDTKLPCILSRNLHPDHYRDITGDNPPLRRKAAGNH